MSNEFSSLLVCDNPKQLDAGSFTCESSKSFGTPCKLAYDGDESTVWTSGMNSLNFGNYGEPGAFRDGIQQWGFNTNIKIILAKEAVVTGVQIINKKDQENFHENYKIMSLRFSNGYAKDVQLANGKQNEISKLDSPVKTSFVNVVGVTTWGKHPDCGRCWPPPKGTGWRSGLSEIRVFGCDAGIFIFIMFCSPCYSR